MKVKFINRENTIIEFESLYYEKIKVDENNFIHSEPNEVSSIVKIVGGYIKQFYKHGKLHNLYGPAAIHHEKRKYIINDEFYWIEGKSYSKSDWEIERNRVIMLNEI